LKFLQLTRGIFSLSPLAANPRQANMGLRRKVTGFSISITRFHAFSAAASSAGRYPAQWRQPIVVTRKMRLDAQMLTAGGRIA
jgi:hypothetical protein